MNFLHSRAFTLALIQIAIATFVISTEQSVATSPHDRPSSRSAHYKRRHKEQQWASKRKKLISRRTEQIKDQEESSARKNVFSRITRTAKLQEIDIVTETAEAIPRSDYKTIYVNSETGSDSNSGTTASAAIKSLSQALTLVENESRPLPGNLIVSLSGTFERERLVLDDSHEGTSSTKRVIFRGEGSNTRFLGGNALSFSKVSELSLDHPARQLANLAGASLDKIYAAPPPSNFPSSDYNLKWPDGDCRDLDNYASPPLLSVDGRVFTRAREPNLPPSTASHDENSTGEVRDTWLRTRALNKQGNVCYKSSDTASINKASDESWNASITLHIFPLVDWYDARVPVASRSIGNSCFATNTDQQSPGNPDGGNKFKIAAEARYYLEGAIEFLDDEGEFHTSLGEVIGSSRGWTLFYPPGVVNLDSAVLSMSKQPILEMDGTNAMYISFDNLIFEGARKYLAVVYGGQVDFHACSFINAGFDGIDSYGESITFRSCIFEGTGGSALRITDSRDFDTDGFGFGLLESGNAVVDSLISDFASTCRHYSEGLALGGYGNLISNNHFRSSNMAAIDIAIGMARILYNVFSHISDGSYDDGAIHWVIESPMERGNEVAYNIFFRNGVSEEPCNAETSCYQADIYMDDMAGAMSIHGNVMIKDKVIQSTPPNDNYSTINWVGILINGGADVSVYENVFLGPRDGSTNGAIYNDKASLFIQTCGGTIWPDGEECGHTGVCADDDFYATMRKYDYLSPPWINHFPELANYNASPASGSDYRCANTRACPMASWNNTVVCNSGVGTNRVLSNRAIWPSDVESSQNDDAEEEVNIPTRNLALKEYGNKVGEAFSENIDSIENAGIMSVLALAERIALSAEATPPLCNEGSRRGASRSKLVGRGRNMCTSAWASGGIQSCDPCEMSSCAPRDLPLDGQCSCGTTSSPVAGQTPSPTTSPTPSSSCNDRTDTFEATKPGDNGWTKMKTCAGWVNRKSTAWRCKFVEGAKDACPKTCTNCCIDSTTSFNLLFNGKTKNCEWAAENPSSRCKKPPTRQKCASICGECE